MPKKSDGQSGGVNISGKNVNIGGNVAGGDQHITYGISGGELAELVKQFQQINQRIEKLPVEPDVKEDLAKNVQRIEEEVKKGEQADPSKVERWLKFIAGMSTDIAEVIGATLLNP